MDGSQIKLVRDVSRTSSKLIKRHLAYRALMSGMVWGAGGGKGMLWRAAMLAEPSRAANCLS